MEKENIEASQKIEEQQSMVEQMIMDLSAIPAKIENLVDGIANISKQTKMVAINAAIEAARVGEYGRGLRLLPGKWESYRTNPVKLQLRYEKRLKRLIH